jgi:hypothetical protein
MKKNTVVLLVATLVIAAVWSGVGAMASSQHQQQSTSLNGRVRALEAKVRSLTSQMTSTKKRVNRLEGLQRCLTAQGLSQYGNGILSGYYYTNDGGYTTILTHATDFDPGTAPTAWMARVDAGCVRSSSVHAFKYERSPSITPKATR